MLFGVELGIWFAVNFILSAFAVHHTWAGFLTWFITFYIIWGIYRSAIHFKETECEGKITYGQCLSYILWLVFFASLVSAAIKVCYLKWGDSSYLGYLYNQSMLTIDQMNLSKTDEERQLLTDSLSLMLQPARFSLCYILIDLWEGLVVSLLLSAFVSRRKTSAPVNE